MRLVQSGCSMALILVGSAALMGSGKLSVSPYAEVNPFIGTAGGGNTFPGATLPFGMVQWSPDTNGDAWYHYDEKSIRGFSLTHVSGAGCPLYGDFAVLPTLAELAASPDSASSATTSPGTDFASYAVGFEHSQEEAHPGYYAVTLANGVRVEISVTERAGIARFTFPVGAPARLLVNAASSAGERDGETNQIALSADGFTGSATAGHFCSSGARYTVYVTGVFDKPFRKSVVWQDGSLQTNAHSAHGAHTGAWLDFGQAREVTLKTGVSFVSVAGARRNVRTEIPGWSLDVVRSAAKAKWSELLGRFAVEGGTPDQRTIFYTGVYHSFLSPNLFSDGNGQYMGFDQRVHAVAGPQTAQYTNFSDWDIYRNTVQLQALFFPRQASDMMQSLVNDAEQSGRLIPRWPTANDATYVMGGDSPAAVIASSHAFGARAFDAEAALRFLVKAATQTTDNRERPFLADELRLGYVPVDKDSIAASWTLEYASDDFAISELAHSLGDEQIAQRFRQRSADWKNLLDPETKMIRPRLSDGSWLPGFDVLRSLPKRKNAPLPSDQQGFEEGNTFQYSFMVPFDYPGLFAAMGGDQVVTQRLDSFFVKLRCWGQPCYNIENEPDFVVPYAYEFAGQPWKTQAVVTRIDAETFKAAPDGIPGNDDLGATSGVYVWNALGMYPAIPGVAGVALGTPEFRRATLRLAGGRTVEITRTGSGIYVKDVLWNGVEFPQDWLPVAKIHTGKNRIEFIVQPEPDRTRVGEPMGPEDGPAGSGKANP